MPKELTKRKENALDYFIVKKTPNFSFVVSSYLTIKSSFLRSKGAQMMQSQLKERNELLGVRLNSSLTINLLLGFSSLRLELLSFSSILFGLRYVSMAVSIFGSGTI